MKPEDIQSEDSTFYVLIIDSNPHEPEVYADLIREVADVKIDIVETIGNSLDWIDQSKYHLVIIEEGPPCEDDIIYDSMGLLEKIRQISPGTSVIIVSENANVEEAVSAIRLGAEDYLSKPINRDSFKLSVRRALDRKTVFGFNQKSKGFLNLLNTCQIISSTLDQKKVFRSIQGYFSRELDSKFSMIYKKEGKKTVTVLTDETQSKDSALVEMFEIAMHVQNPIKRMSEVTDDYLFVEKTPLSPGLFIFRFKTTPKEEFFCVCLSPTQPTPIEGFESRLRTFKAQIEVTIRNIEQYRGVENLVYVDEATGLYNTRYLNTSLEKEIALADANQTSFAVLFIDADHFKQVNDIHGHLIGTKLLNELGCHIKKFVRDQDTVFRYGGDEFVAVLSQCDLETARRVAERIRSSVEKREFIQDEGLKIHITVSIGVALYPDHAKSKKDVINCADTAMYEAKKKSRNVVYLTSDLNQKTSKTKS
ncbi:MAG: hypothetical protein CL678_18045 [Bdellovibrionaceae bacterium]|nr:hypothetical protein [Pseudobdellovibrionaceae bacterium]|tara:strand:+ start:772 stop:2205 length:1434 start_codon:yes stop_codon:yes gene_type:complete